MVAAEGLVFHRFAGGLKKIVVVADELGIAPDQRAENLVLIDDIGIVAGAGKNRGDADVGVRGGNGRVTGALACPTRPCPR